MATNGSGVGDLAHKLLAVGFLYLVALEAAVAAPESADHAATNYPEAIELPRFAVDKLIKLKTSKQLRAQSGQPVDLAAPFPGEDIPDASSNPEIIYLAEFAVKEYNKKKGKNLEFKNVVSAREQVLTGTINYYIELVVVEDGYDSTYSAQVWAKPWDNIKVLVAFDALDQ